jgi:hypothetical protein
MKVYNLKSKNLKGEGMKGLICVFVFLMVFAVSGFSLVADTEPVIRSYKFSAYLDNGFLGFNNGNLTNLNEESYLAVQNTDDRLFVALSELGVAFEADILGIINFQADFSYGGFWGNDSLSYGSPENRLNARYLNFDLDIAKAFFYNDGFDFNLMVGRLPYQIIDTDKHKNYIMRDVIDAVVLSVFFPSVYLGADLFADFFSLNSPTDTVYALKSSRHDYTVDYFDGDVNIIRFGLIPKFIMDFDNNFLSLLDARPFALFTRIGATGKGHYHAGGYERSAMGFEGNYADNDWVFVTGIDALLETSVFSFLVEFGYSMGIDRRAKGFPDVNISGILVHGSLDMDFGFVGIDWLCFGASGLYVSGAETDEYGNFINYGFVSFKGHRLGGFLFSRYYGIYPSAIINYSGIDFEPIKAARRAPVLAASANVGIDKLSFSGEEDTGLYAMFEGWVYFDTSSTSMDTNLNLQSYVYDQRRLGNFMGIEVNGDISYTLTRQILEIGTRGGIFIPMDYFFYPVSLRDAPYGTSIFWGVEVYTKLKF